MTPHAHPPPPCAVLLQIKKKSIDKAKKDDRMSKEFAAMEDAALKAYEEDMKRLQAESGNARESLKINYWPLWIKLMEYNPYLLY